MSIVIGDEQSGGAARVPCVNDCPDDCWAKGQTFECRGGCGRTVPYCFGGADLDFEACNDCAARRDQERARTTATPITGDEFEEVVEQLFGGKVQVTPLVETRSSGVILDCPVCGAERHFIINNLTPHTGFCMTERRDYPVPFWRADNTPEERAQIMKLIHLSEQFRRARTVKEASDLLSDLGAALNVFAAMVDHPRGDAAAAADSTVDDNTARPFPAGTQYERCRVCGVVADSPIHTALPGDRLTHAFVPRD